MKAQVFAGICYILRLMQHSGLYAQVSVFPEGVMGSNGSKKFYPYFLLHKNPHENVWSNFSRKKISGQKIFESKSFWPKNFASNKIFVSKFFLIKFFLSEQNFGSKIFGPNKFGSEIFEPKRIFGQKKFSLKNF